MSILKPLISSKNIASASLTHIDMYHEVELSKVILKIAFVFAFVGEDAPRVQNSENSVPSQAVSQNYQ